MPIPKIFKQGTHIIVLPLDRSLVIERVFPREISGAWLESLNAHGRFENKSKILYIHGMFQVDDFYKKLHPFQVLRVTLTRTIMLDWQVDLQFSSHHNLEQKVLPYADEYSVQKALYLMQICELMYSEKDVVESTLKEKYDYQDVFYFSRMSAHQRLIRRNYLNLLYFFFRSKKTVVDLQFVKVVRHDPSLNKHIILLTFKGSKELEDWATNLSALGTNFVGKAQANVHQGFQDTLKVFIRAVKRSPFKIGKETFRLAEEVLSQLNEHSKIILTGHSLGGAIATLAACFFYDKGVSAKNLEVYTFGAPPVGSQDFVKHYEGCFPIYRVVNEYDPIPKLNNISNLYHLGEEFMLPSNNGEVHTGKGYIDNLFDAL